ncbi:MAG: NAD-dependent epimerase/dehydratase family protein [Myxococcales bacterium]|nr:MAG: NAD-dependent epimerase/dehydratase family protein [Myxococcales bacterium]
MIAVVGATGGLGGAICQALASRGEHVRALVRESTSADRLSELKAQAVELVHGDLRSPANLHALCTGSRTVISSASALNSRVPGDTIRSVDEVGHLELIEAAEAAGVDQLIYVSLLPQVVSSPLEEAKVRVEQRLKGSGMSYTVLRPALFTEAWLSPKYWPVTGFDFIKRRARLAGAGQRPVQWISLADVARYAVSAIDNPACHQLSFDLAGPEALSPLQVVQLLEHAGGPAFEVDHVSEQDLRARQSRGDVFEQSFCALLLSCALGLECDAAPARTAMPFELSTVSSYISRITKHL